MKGRSQVTSAGFSSRVIFRSRVCVCMDCRALRHLASEVLYARSQNSHVSVSNLRPQPLLDPSAAVVLVVGSHLCGA